VRYHIEIWETAGRLGHLDFGNTSVRLQVRAPAPVEHHIENADHPEFARGVGHSH